MPWLLLPVPTNADCKAFNSNGDRKHMWPIGGPQSDINGVEPCAGIWVRDGEGTARPTWPIHQMPCAPLLSMRIDNLCRRRSSTRSHCVFSMPWSYAHSLYVFGLELVQAELASTAAWPSQGVGLCRLTVTGLQYVLHHCVSCMQALSARSFPAMSLCPIGTSPPYIP